MRTLVLTLTVVTSLFMPAQAALAQEKPAAIVELVVGRSGFVDEAWDYFTTVGGGARWFITPRLAIGPEVAYMRGAFDSLDASNLSLTANLSFDLLPDNGERRTVPYVVAGGGYLRQRTLVGRGPGVPGLEPFVAGEGTVSAGFGTRVRLNSRLFVAPEFRLGWEPEVRIAVTVGIRMH